MFYQPFKLRSPVPLPGRRNVPGQPLLFATLLAVLFLCACAAEPELLNSDRIEDRFGSYGVEIIRADEHQRVSCLYSDEANGKVCRTIAIVDFQSPIDPRISSEHDAIVAGGSIGQVFRASAWAIDKHTLAIDEIPVRDLDAGIAGLMQIDAGELLARHRYRFDIEKAGVGISYATITEIHHPAYLRLPRLRAIYGYE